MYIHLHFSPGVPSNIATLYQPVCTRQIIHVYRCCMNVVDVIDEGVTVAVCKLHCIQAWNRHLAGHGDKDTILKM